MRRNWKLLVCGLMAVALWSQEQKQIMVHLADGAVPPPDMGVAGQANKMWFLADIDVREGKLVQNAPYSAEGVTEFTQTLADGTRITRKNQTVLARDSQGRTRREQTLQVFGPWATGGEPAKSIMIHDSVAKETYVLNPADKTARKLSAPGGTGVFVERHEDKTKDGGTQVIQRDIHFGPPGAGAVGSGPLGYQARQLADPKSESLGKQTIEGVVAEGTRTTRVIPAGEIGNDRPITIVSERWFSPELQVTVRSKTTDPMAGDTVYRLTNVNRSEPAAALFQVPADYTVKEDTGIQIQKTQIPPR